MIARIKSIIAGHRNLALLAAALACGVVAVVAGRGYLAQQLEEERTRLAPKPTRTVDVVVARQELGKGDLIGPQTMAVRGIPADFVSSSAIRPDQFDDFVGMRLAIALRGGEQLVAGAIVGGDNMTFSHRVKPGIRALTIAVDEINSISGMLQPGDRIDLLFSARLPGSGASPGQAPEATVPLFQSLLVLATGKQVRAGVDERGTQRSFSTVTVEVEPEHAQRLVVAQRAGKLTAVLRNPDDLQRMAHKAMDIRQLLELPDVVATVRQGPQIIVGGLGRLPALADEFSAKGMPGGPAAINGAPSVVSGHRNELSQETPQAFDKRESDAPRKLR